jgi:hypothetical protein
MGVFVGGYIRAALAVALAVVVGGVALSGCAPTPSPAPPPTSSASASPTRAATSAPSASPGFADGSVFDQKCAIAWPTEPVVSASSIQLTLTCANVPSSMYVFVVAIYDDPELAITRATTTVRVSGRVSDTAVTSTGLSYLIVQATDISL